MNGTLPISCSVKKAVLTYTLLDSLIIIPEGHSCVGNDNNNKNMDQKFFRND